MAVDGDIVVLVVERNAAKVSSLVRVSLEVGKDYRRPQTMVS